MQRKLVLLCLFETTIETIRSLERASACERSPCDAVHSCSHVVRDRRRASCVLYFDTVVGLF